MRIMAKIPINLDSVLVFHKLKDTYLNNVNISIFWHLWCVQTFRLEFSLVKINLGNTVIFFKRFFQNLLIKPYGRRTRQNRTPSALVKESNAIVFLQAAVEDILKFKSLQSWEFYRKMSMCVAVLYSSMQYDCGKQCTSVSHIQIITFLISE